MTGVQTCALPIYKDFETRGVQEKEIKKITIEVLSWVKEIYSGLGVLIALC